MSNRASKCLGKRVNSFDRQLILSHSSVFSLLEIQDILLDEFKDGAFRLAIEHQIPIIPMTFADNKKRFSYTFFSGSPGRMRVTIHKFLSTEGKEVADKKEMSKTARDIILNELKVYGAY